ncbi:MAG: hypothetical protein ABF449_10630 [Ethanoligenens sp.]
MTEEQEGKCHAIIHAASALAAGIGAGLAQLPCSDNAAIIPIQITMVISLGAVFGVELSKSTATATLASATGTLVGRGLSEVLVGWVPVIGNIINATTAAGVTETIGWTVAQNFDKQTGKRLCK